MAERWREGRADARRGFAIRDGLLGMGVWDWGRFGFMLLVVLEASVSASDTLSVSEGLG